MALSKNEIQHLINTAREKLAQAEVAMDDLVELDNEDDWEDSWDESWEEKGFSFWP